MPLEYEHSFYDFTKKDVIKKIKNLGFTHKGTFLFKVQTFIHPLDVKKTYIRVRDEGFRVTMTYKLSSDSAFDEEVEVNVDNFDSAIKLLENIGCKKKYYYEKIREIWDYKDVEIVFDTNPGNLDRMEVEAKSLKELNKILKELGLNSKMHDNSNKYLEIFGIEIPKNLDLKFKSVKKDLLPHVKKNKKEFIELITEQLNKYKKVIKK